MTDFEADDWYSRQGVFSVTYAGGASSIRLHRRGHPNEAVYFAIPGELDEASLTDARRFLVRVLVLSRDRDWSEPLGGTRGSARGSRLN